MTTTVNRRSPGNHRPPATFADLPGLMSLMTGDDKHDQAATSTLTYTRFGVNSKTSAPKTAM